MTCGLSTSKGDNVTISVKQNGTYAAATGVWVKVNGVWKKVSGDDGLAGIGGWATITGVTGTYTKHTYGDWVAYEWTDDGTVTTSGGLVDALIVGAGGNTDSGYSYSGTGGGVIDNVFEVGTTVPVKVGKPGSGYSPANNGGGFSQLGDVRIGGGGYAQSRQRQPNGYLNETSTGRHSGAGAGGDAPDPDTGGAGHSSAIRNNTAELYARGGGKAPHSSPRPGDGADRQNNGGTAKGIAGVVILRVPKEYAENVQETFHGWDSFALVTDSVVTDVTRVPDNEPRTLDAEWLPCGADVQPGWDHADGDFTPPPAPTKDDLIDALQAQIKDLQKD